MDPLEEYTARRDRWETRRGVAARQFIRIGNWRLAVAIIAVVPAFFAFGRQAISAWWLLAPLLLFVALVVWHQFVLRGRTVAERAVRFYEHGIARFTGGWIGKGNTGDQFRNPEHVYADDLDVFGTGSLFQLIATTRTASGEQTLAEWLRSPATAEEALARQEAVRELTDRLDLREDIALAGEEVRAEVHESAIQAWGYAAPIVFPPYMRMLALVLAVLTIATLIEFLTQALTLSPFAAVLGCDFVVAYLLRKRVLQIVAGAGTPGHDLRTFSLILQRLEHEQFALPLLKQLRAGLDVEGLPASKRIAQLKRWMDLLDSSEHLLLRLIGPGVLWREQIAMGIETWRRRHGEHVARWVRSVAEFEALSSFAAIKFERPLWTFPAFKQGEPRFEARALQHPLMPPAKCVPNDVTIGGEQRVLIVSGSNMSGKSTLLRSIGLNTVLAWAGSPVAANQMQISALQAGASIRIVDSLLENRSRFFAEIVRIRKIAELARNRHVLFLLDELLSGTNSHDRRIGASGIVRALVHAGAIGLITTHDLALAEIERDLGAAAVNVHFDDQIADGRIEFDYRLRPGVVTRSNALELMRAIGLDV
jgi:uncharacterized membrane protein